MALGSVQILHKSLEEAKKSLDDTNQAIQKMSGRDSRYSSQTDRSTSGSHMRAWSEDYLPPAKRRVGNDWKRSSNQVNEDDVFDDDINKPSSDNTYGLKSSVSAAPVPPRPIADPNTDVASKLRNRRMFGMLMGTLQKFQKDASHVSEQEKKRVQIETKLEQEAIREREEAAQHKRQLLDQRKMQRQLVGKLASQLELAELYEEWNIHDRNLYGFIKTSTTPRMFYLPSKHNDTTEELLKNCQISLEEVITARQNEIKSLLQSEDNSSVDNIQLQASTEVTEQSDSLVIEECNNAQSEH